MIGTPLGILQLVLHYKYWKRKVVEEPNKVDVLKGSLEKEGYEIGDMEKGNMEKNATFLVTPTLEP